MTITLYYAPRACTLAPCMALHEAGAKFEVETLDLGAGDQRSDAYRAINPKMRVPALVVDGAVLTENVAILTWIAHKYPVAELMPSEPMPYAQALSLMAWFASGIHPSLTPLSRPGVFCDMPDSAESVRRLARTRLNDAFRVAEGFLGGREWLLDRFGVVDAYFFWCTRRAGQLGIDFSAYPNCHAHFERVALRPSAQRVLAHETEVLQKQSPH